MAFSTPTRKRSKHGTACEIKGKIKEPKIWGRERKQGKGGRVRTRRLNPETLAREVAMAAEESGSTPGRCPTIMLEET